MEPNIKTGLRMVLWGSVLFHLIAFAVLIEGKSSESSSIPYHIRRHLAEPVQKEELISGINPTEDLLADPGSIGQREQYKTRGGYDFIIVGGGATGSVLAARLSENPKFKVLLLEAGPVGDVSTEIPAAMYLHSEESNFTRKYQAEKTEGACLGSIGSRCSFASGYGLGGSTLINNMLVVRGNAEDYNAMADNGNKGWSYKDLLPYFKRTEIVGLDFPAHRDYRSDEGPWSVETPSFLSKLSHHYLEAAKELNHDIIDFNGEQQVGSGSVQVSTLDGRRHSAAAAYLYPVYKKRTNLSILTGATVTRVLIDDLTKAAFGVEYRYNGRMRRAVARHEIILSAGTFRSAQLLMLSGIGRRSHLKEHGIICKKDLPVGENLHDHLVFPGISVFVNTLPEDKKSVTQEKQDNQILTSVGYEAVSFLKLPNSSLNAFYPDVELLMFNRNLKGLNFGEGLWNTLNLKPDIYKLYQKSSDRGQIGAISLLVVPLQPTVRGRVKLRSKKIETSPVIEMPFFGEEEDMQVMLDGIKQALMLLQTPEMERIGARLSKVPVPGCEMDFGTDEYWRCAIRVLAVPFNDHGGTVKMGPTEDEKSVVGETLKVHGISKLRVADRSVLPAPIAGQTQAITYVIGEKLADLIKEEYQEKDAVEESKKVAAELDKDVELAIGQMPVDEGEGREMDRLVLKSLVPKTIQKHLDKKKKKDHDHHDHHHHHHHHHDDDEHHMDDHPKDDRKYFFRQDKLPDDYDKEIEIEVKGGDEKPKPEENGKEMPKEKSDGKSKDDPPKKDEKPKEEPKEMSKDNPKEMPKEEPKEIPKEKPKEMPKENPKMPKEKDNERPKWIPDEKPEWFPDDKPRDHPPWVYRPIFSPKPDENPKEMPQEEPKEISKETPKEMPKMPKEKDNEWPKWKPEDKPRWIPQVPHDEFPKETDVKEIPDEPEIVEIDVKEPEEKEIEFKSDEKHFIDPRFEIPIEHHYPSDTPSELPPCHQPSYPHYHDHREIPVHEHVPDYPLNHGYDLRNYFGESPKTSSSSSEEHSKKRKNHQHHHMITTDHVPKYPTTIQVIPPKFAPPTVTVDWQIPFYLKQKPNYHHHHQHHHHYRPRGYKSSHGSHETIFYSMPKAKVQMDYILPRTRSHRHKRNIAKKDLNSLDEPMQIQLPTYDADLPVEKPGNSHNLIKSEKLVHVQQSRSPSPRPTPLIPSAPRSLSVELSIRPEGFSSNQIHTFRGVLNLISEQRDIESTQDRYIAPVASSLAAPQDPTHDDPSLRYDFTIPLENTETEDGMDTMATEVFKESSEESDESDESEEENYHKRTIWGTKKRRRNKSQGFVRIMTLDELFNEVNQRPGNVRESQPVEGMIFKRGESQVDATGGETPPAEEEEAAAPEEEEAAAEEEPPAAEGNPTEGEAEQEAENPPPEETEPEIAPSDPSNNSTTPSTPTSSNSPSSTRTPNNNTTRSTPTSTRSSRPTLPSPTPSRRTPSRRTTTTSSPSTRSPETTSFPRSLRTTTHITQRWGNSPWRTTPMPRRRNNDRDPIPDPFPSTTSQQPPTTTSRQPRTTRPSTTTAQWPRNREIEMTTARNDVDLIWSIRRRNFQDRFPNSPLIIRDEEEDREPLTTTRRPPPPVREEVDENRFGGRPVGTFPGFNFMARKFPTNNPYPRTPIQRKPDFEHSYMNKGRQSMSWNNISLSFGE